MWVLIIVLSAGMGGAPISVHTQEFSSLEKCKYAAQFLEIMNKTRRDKGFIYYDCTPK